MQISKSSNIALIVVFGALIAVSTLAPEITLAGGVPVSLQTFAVVLAGLVLGPWRGWSAVSLYLLLGLAGAPIFSNNVGGLAIFGRPSWGYLLGMWVAVVVVGLSRNLLARLIPHPPLISLVLAGLTSIPVTYAIGVPILAQKLGIPVWNAPATCFGDGGEIEACISGLSVGVIPFLPGDLIKVALAATIASLLHRSYPQLWLQVRRTETAKDDQPESARR